MPKQDLPKQDLPKQDLPKQDLPKQDLPKQDLPKQDLPKQDLPKQDMPKQDMPKQDMPKQVQVVKIADQKADLFKGKAGIRVINASDAGAVDVRSESGVDFANLAFVGDEGASQAQAQYKQIDARQDVKIQVFKAQSQQKVWTSQDLRFEAGKSYTLIVDGSAGAGTESEGVQVRVIED